MKLFTKRCATGALLLGLLAGGCGGGGTPAAITFTVLGLAPATSVDLNGGDRVTITGRNFDAFIAFGVTFGGIPGLNVTVVDDATIEVTTPPSASAGAVTVEVTGVDLDAQQLVRSLVNAFTYVGAPANPNPQTITPTVFTPSGAQSFTIGGTDLGPSGGQVFVEFAGIGTVRGTVSIDGTLVTGNATVSAGVPPTGLITVTIDPAGAAAAVPTQVTYAFTQPQILPMPFQDNGNASQPVRLTDGAAVMCTAGADGVWSTVDDDVFLVIDTGGSVQAIQITDASGPNPAIGHLNRLNSIPAVLDADTFCVYSLGTDNTPNTGDDEIVLVTSARSIAPVVTHNLVPHLNTAPIQALSSTRVACTTAGPDLTRGTQDDDLRVFQLSGTTLTGVGGATVGAVDATAGSGNFSLPTSVDGINIFILVLGLSTPGIAGDLDDMIVHYSTATQAAASPVSMPYLLRRPVALSATQAAGVGFGLDGGPGGSSTSADQYLVATFTAPDLVVTNTPLGRTVDAAALHPFARVGAEGVAVAALGLDGAPNTNDEEVLVFPTPAAALPNILSIPGSPLFGPLGSAELIVSSRGADLLAGTGDEIVTRINAAGTSATNFRDVPLSPLLVAPGTDGSRAFVIGPGPDGNLGTFDEELIVHQSRALGSVVIGQGFDTAVLPASVAPNGFVGGTNPFVPVGPDWGLIQSPGGNQLFGGADDQILVVRY